jgi:superfamily II RNA helicase
MLGSAPVSARARALEFLPSPEAASSDAILDGFLAYVDAIGLTLYPAQEEAILQVTAGSNLILNTPTGSGKSLVFSCAAFQALATGKRAFYTCPIKALANEKFFALAREFGADNVGLMTGDASVNRDAPIICATAEILANMALSEGADAKVDHVTMDEFHYYADKERGVAWQIPLLVLSRATFLLMSATLGDTEPFEKRLATLTGKPATTVRSNVRPVPLELSYRETPLHETIAELLREGKAPIYLVNFSQRGAAEEAQNLLSVDVCTKDEKKAIAEAILGARWNSPYGKELSRFVKHGIGIHHAGLLPKYRLLIEKLAQQGLLKIVSGTDTLGVGVNVPIRTVLFTRLCRFDGENTRILSARDFHQISGRAGRKGYDDRGFVCAQAPEHVIENLRMEAKAAGDPKKLRKLVKRKPPERGFVMWNRETFDKLTVAQPEPLQSRFSVSHAMLLSVLGRSGKCLDVGRLIDACHDRDAEKRIHKKTALSMFKSLVDAEIVNVERTGHGRRVFVRDALQLDFSLNHALSLYLVDTLEKVDKESPTHALDVLTLVECILENPEQILMRQKDKLFGEMLAELKAQGVPYEERQEKLEQLEHPKPLAEFVYSTYNEFRRLHPWAGADNVKPKSIARDMVEQFLSFPEYVKEYGLERVEGLLLRYLSDAYKTLVSNVPEEDKTDEIVEIQTFLGAMVKEIDASILDEWEKMRDPDRAREIAARGDRVEPAGTQDITSDARAFSVLVRNRVFDLVRDLSRGAFEEALERLGEGAGVTKAALEEGAKAFRAAHGAIRIDTEARSPKHLHVDKEDYVWRVKQVLLDEEGPTDFFIEGRVDLEASRGEGRAVVRIDRIANG